MIELDTEQEAAVQKMVNEPTKASLNASQYGVGKTVVAVELGKRLGGAVNLIICPLFTKKSWAKTIIGQGIPEYDVHMIDSTKAGRENLSYMLNGVKGWYIIGREYFRTKQDIINPISQRISFAAYDECQAWANHKSLGFRKMKAFRPAYRHAMSATPARNKFTGMYAITQWLWPKFEGHASYWKWVADWCETEEDYFSGVVVKGEREPGEFVKSLPCYVRLEKDFGDPVELEISIDLSARERKIYDQIEKRMIAWLRDNPLVIKFPHTKRMRLRQATLGEINITEDDGVHFPVDMKSTKYETLVKIIEEADEPALIFTQSQKYASVVVERLQADGYRALEWSGAVTEKNREYIKDWFLNEEIDFIVATPASIGEGTDGLQHRARLMIWLDRSDDGMTNEQAFRRLHRRGQTKQVVSISIIAEDTYDRGQLAQLIEQQVLMNRSLKKGV